MSGIQHIFAVDYDNGCQRFAENIELPAADESKVLVLLFVPQSFEINNSKLHAAFRQLSRSSPLMFVRSYSDEKQAADVTMVRVCSKLVEHVNNSNSLNGRINLRKVDAAFEHPNSEYQSIYGDDFRFDNKLHFHIVSGTEGRYPALAAELNGVNQRYRDSSQRFCELSQIDGSNQTLPEVLRALPGFQDLLCHSTACNMVFRNKQARDEHFASRHPPCRWCKCSWTDTVRHQQTYRPCTVCNATVCSEVADTHMSQHPVCSCCNVQFTTTERMQLHKDDITLHPVRCQQAGCSQRLRTHNDLAEHKRNQHPDSCFACHQCHKLLTSEKNHRMHTRKHHGSIATALPAQLPVFAH